MSPIKKLIFAPLFLVLLTTSIYFYKLILDAYLEVYFGTYGGLYEFALLAIPLSLATLSYSLFITFTQDFKYALVIAIIASLIPFAFLNLNLSIVISIGIIISLIIVYFNLQTSLRSYINFQATTLLKGPIKLLNVFILLTLTFGYFLNANSIIQTQGFKLPDSLIDWAVTMSMSSQNMNFKGVKYQIAQLTSDQIELLKQNPAILEQYGYKPEDLDALTPIDSQPSTATTPNSNTTQAVPLPQGNLKEILKTQINTMLDQTLKPYLFVIPILLAFMFYSLASLILWLLTLLLSPIIQLIFFIFEKSNFIKFATETREVKKIII